MSYDEGWRHHQIKIAEQEQIITELREQLAQTQKVRDNYFLESERNMGTAASLQRERDRALSELADLKEKIKKCLIF